MQSITEQQLPPSPVTPLPKQQDKYLENGKKTNLLLPFLFRFCQFVCRSFGIVCVCVTEWMSICVCQCRCSRRRRRRYIIRPCSVVTNLLLLSQHFVINWFYGIVCFSKYKRFDARNWIIVLNYDYKVSLFYRFLFCLSLSHSKPRPHWYRLFCVSLFTFSLAVKWNIKTTTTTTATTTK